MTSDGPPLLRPRPVRPFEIGPLSSTPTSTAASPEREQHTARSPTIDDSPANTLPSRSRSILNLTSSTLAGVFGYNTSEEPQTPYGTGAETPIDGLRQELGDIFSSNSGSNSDKKPATRTSGMSVDEAYMLRSRERRGSMLEQSTKQNKPNIRKRSVKRKTVKHHFVPLLTKTIAMGAVGVVYGSVISHLHDQRRLAPVPVDGIEHDSPYYLAFWGMTGITLGWLMPYVDSVWNAHDDDDDAVSAEYKMSSPSSKRRSSGNNNGRTGWAPVWNDLVRTLGAFCGLAFAIRRVPWHSTLQLSLTLALCNPALWYLLDRTAPGFILSTTVALSGTALLLGINPSLVPAPATQYGNIATSSLANATARLGAGGVGGVGKEGELAGLVAGLFSHEAVGVATWIASVLFVSCVCFGNIGRRL